MKAKPDLYTESESTRRKLAEDYRRRAADPRCKRTDRAAFLHMAETWERTLPKGKKKA